MLSPWFVYMVRTCQDTLYTGVTTDVDRRFSEHCQGGRKSARYLRGKAPLTLAWHQVVASKQQAMQLEYRVKRLPRRTKDKLVLGLLHLGDLFPEINLNSQVLEMGKSVE
ncbi:GIY-YIG nuclease family protein [Marinomonas fungiae]|uniref:GIY-YIG nuclease family protein n=1 Tax=Marinomonas fungiae TaxID=1137284 RepID=UPI003A94A412